MTILVKYFGSIAEKTGLPSEAIEIEANVDSDLLEQSIRSKYDLSDQNYKLAVNLELIQDKKILLH